MNLMNCWPFTNVSPISTFLTFIYSIGGYLYSLCLNECLNCQIVVMFVVIAETLR